MKILFSIILLLFSRVILNSQTKKEFYVCNNHPVKITKPPIQLKVTDTLYIKRNIYEAEYELGGLTPQYPIAETYENFLDFDYGFDFYLYDYVSCLKKYHTSSGHCFNYLVLIDNQIIEIYSKEKFKDIFAPVESKEEALSFAFALSDICNPTTIYNFDFLNDEGTDYEIFRKELKPTTVKEVDDGYEVLLFSTYWGFKSYCSEIIIFVSKKGDVKIIKKVNLFNDKNFNMEID